MNRLLVSGFERIEAVYYPPLRATDTVAAGQWVTVHGGWVLPIFSAVFVVDGFLRLDGVLRVECD